MPFLVPFLCLLSHLVHCLFCICFTFSIFNDLPLVLLCLFGLHKIPCFTLFLILESGPVHINVFYIKPWMTCPAATEECKAKAHHIVLGAQVLRKLCTGWRVGTNAVPGSQREVTSNIPGSLIRLECLGNVGKSGNTADQNRINSTATLETMSLLVLQVHGGSLTRYGFAREIELPLCILDSDLYRFVSKGTLTVCLSACITANCGQNQLF